MAKLISGLEDLLPISEVETVKLKTTKNRISPSSSPQSKAKKDSIDYLSNSIDSFTHNTTSSTIVKNVFPTIQQTYRIAIIGEFPNRDEELQGSPFVGISGQVLTNLLSKAGIVRSACFLGNICQRRPTNNDINLADHFDIEEGLTQLTKDLNIFNPHICLLLGAFPLSFAKAKTSIGDWRGSYFISSEAGVFFGRKCLASYHPAVCLRNYEWMPLLMFDIKRTYAESKKPTLLLPNRTLITNLTSYEIVTRLQQLLQSPQPISIDIEGGINSMSCISIATSPFDSFIIPFSLSNGDNYWTSFDDEFDIWTELSKVLADSRINKILQNALYDRFVLQYSYSLCVVNNTEDTMLKHWELYCELEKGLGFLCSLYTNEPFYKFERKSDDIDVFFKYCCKDSAVTYEISSKLEPMLCKESMQHYRFNVELLNAMLYMELKGIKYDNELAQKKLKEVNNWIYGLQYELDTISNFGLKLETPISEILTKIQEIMCFKKDQNTPRKGFQQTYPLIKDLLISSTQLTKESITRINMLCGFSLNIKSSIFKTYLYETLQLPKQYAKEENKTGTKSLTTDGKALLKIQKKSPHKAVELAIQIGELRTRSQMLHISSDEDGRIRCGYNIVGASTGRITCYTSPTGSGYNLQTIPDDYESYPEDHPLRHGMRDLFIADPGYHMFQCDLKGSDGWTIGANMAALGDPSMLDDLRYGIKPASRICYMLRHGNGSLLRKPREEVKHLLKEIKKTDWDYFACKVGIWGICYLMGIDLLADEIAEESQGKLWMSRKEVEDFRNAVFAGYNVKLWHNAMAVRLAKSPTLTVPSGHKRRFFSRKTEILGQALAHEPQAVTTYATNLAAWKLWRDRENRTKDFKYSSIRDNGIQKTSILEIMPNSSTGEYLKIQPLHQVHDALIGQFRKEDTTWAVSKLKSYFDNEIMIAGIPITIPFEGNYGKNWADLSEGVI